MVDPDRVRRLLGVLGSYRRKLAELAQLSAETYLEQQAFAGRYLVQASAQTCIDLANHVIASEGWRVPTDFRDAFAVLAENGVLDHDLAERLQALAGLRNRLVHLYSEVDDRLVHQALAGRLGDLDAFARAVAQLLQP